MAADVDVRSRSLAPAVAIVVGVGVALLAVGWQSGGYGLATRSAAGVVVWLAVLVAASFVPQPVARLRGVPALAIAALTAFAIETGASAAWGDSAEHAIDELGRVVLFLGVVVLVLLLARRGDLARWCDGLAVGILAVALLALASRLFPQIVHGLAPLDFLSGRQSRLAYPLGYWTGLGVLVALAAPLFIRAAVEARTGWARAASVAAMPPLVAVLYLTSARLGFVVAAIGIAAYVALSRHRFSALVAAFVGGAASGAAVEILRRRPRLVDGPFTTPAAHADGRVAALSIAVVCAAGAVLYAFAAPRIPQPRPLSRRVLLAIAGLCVVALATAVALSHPVARFDAFRATPPGLEQAPVGEHLVSGSSNGRWQLWTSAAREFVRYPFLGHGAGSYEAWWAAHGHGRFFVRNAHSLFLETLGTLGIVGFLGLLAFFAVPVVASRRILRTGGEERETVAAAVATLVAFLVSAALDWMWEMTVVAIVGIVCAAIVVRAPPLPSPRRVSRTLAAAAVVASVGALALELALVLGSYELGRSRGSVAAGDLSGARAAARTATRLEPWAATPRLQLALVAERANDLQEARREIERALARDRSDWRLWFVAARIDRKLGDRELARRESAQAAALNPRSQLVGGG